MLFIFILQLFVYKNKFIINFSIFHLLSIFIGFGIICILLVPT